MNGQIPLYIGIPVALLCVSVFLFVVILIVTLWNDWRDSR